MKQKGYSPIKSGFAPIIILVLVVLGLVGYFAYKNYWPKLQISPSPTPAAENEVLGIRVNTCCSCPTRIPRSLIGTDGWVIYERGKNYAEFLPEECDRVDCKPCPPPEEENQSKIDCKDPRPEVCTFECTYPPPYLCGSDGKSYCTVCQACSNKAVAWYEMKNSLCEEEKFCGGFAGVACPEGYSCKLDGNYPDAGGVCTKN